MSKKTAFIFGFISLLLCGVGDWLIGYEPEGGEKLIYGITTTAISGVPTWFYVLSFFFGILSGFGCLYFAPAIMETLDLKGISKDSKMYKLMGFGLKSAPMMFVSFHIACCIVLMLIQAALRAGLDITAADSVFLIPAATALIPFVIWCYLCDIPVTIAYMYFTLKGKLGINKAAFILCPMGLSIAAKIIAAVMVAMGSKLSFLTACGESWGYAFMCLAFYFAVNKEGKVNT
ncbi:MAG: hypothetical protein IKE53_01900 [Clostridiales bacterium]|nr:hypothetical protein [Clostridiales bacterium]